MGERYLITGVQLGMLIEIPKEQRQKTVEQIIDKQFIGESSSSIEDDTKLLVRILEVEGFG